MDNNIESVILSQQEIADTVKALAKRIDEDYAEKTPVLLGLLKGSFVFLADMVRSLHISFTVDFLRASSYKGTARSPGAVAIEADEPERFSGRDIIIIEDILDTGATVSAVAAQLMLAGARSVKLCALLDKPSRRKISVEADYTGKTIDDVFVVGYGMDYDEKYRGLPYIGVLKSAE